MLLEAAIAGGHTSTRSIGKAQPDLRKSMLALSKEDLCRVVIGRTQAFAYQEAASGHYQAPLRHYTTICQHGSSS